MGLFTLRQHAPYMYYRTESGSSGPLRWHAGRGSGSRRTAVSTLGGSKAVASRSASLAWPPTYRPARKRANSNVLARHGPPLLLPYHNWFRLGVCGVDIFQASLPGLKSPAPDPIKMPPEMTGRFEWPVYPICTTSHRASLRVGDNHLNETGIVSKQGACDYASDLAKTGKDSMVLIQDRQGSGATLDQLDTPLTLWNAEVQVAIAPQARESLTKVGLVTLGSAMSFWKPS
jgi:hypothetical protein